MDSESSHDPQGYRIEKLLALIFAILFFLPLVLRADDGDGAAPLVKAGDVTRPSMLVKTNARGLYLEAPALQTAIHFEIRGIVARGTVQQRFENPTGHCIEAIYVFPLPENAAVDTLKMTVAGRTMEGEIKERLAAQQTYDDAKAAGQHASLLEQERPNLFKVTLASIGPHEPVEIEIGYQQTLRYDAGAYSLRFPLAITPRYDPGTGGPGVTAAPQLAANAARNPVTIDADLDAGAPLRDVTSSTHAIATSILSGSRWHVALRDASAASDRDFELVWHPQLGSEPHAAMFTETVGGNKYALLMLFPPSVAQASTVVLPRESIFIIDTSGSMEGTSMTQAKQALGLALDKLHRGDSFNVIEFNSTATRLFPESRSADRDAVAEAHRWVDALHANGGTEMVPALTLALEQPPVTGTLRQVIFMTDGGVSNEAELFAYIRAHLGNARLFTVAIGSAPNSAFMRGAARLGRGTFTYVSNVGEVEQKVGDLFRKIESPVLSGIQMTLDDPSAEVSPGAMPDLYAGEPLVVTARYTAPTVNARLTGRLGTNDWNETASAPADRSSGIARLWAQQQVEALTDSLADGGDPEQVRGRILAIALEHHLVTELTSLVAVDTTPTGVNPALCTRELVPINLPAGYEGASGALPQTATAGSPLLLGGALLLLAAGLVRRLA